MAKLIFRYGAMGASKTASLLTVRFNYIERKMKPLLLKPSCEDRDGEMTVKSRIGISAEADYTVESFLKKLFEENDRSVIGGVDIILVDEAQFLTPDQVDRLSDVVDFYGITVLCYGLKTDFKGRLFPGSWRLLELSDNIEEIPTICWCGKKARFNARICNGRIVKEGEQVVLGGNESYVSLCREHFKTGDLGPLFR